MPPKGDKNRKKSDDTGEDEEIVMRVMEALTDERIAKSLRKMLHPRELIDRMDAMGRSIDNLTTQLASKEETISKLEKKIEALENSVDDTEQYTRRSNLIFRGFAELGRGEDTDARILALVNDEMDLAPPLQLADIARSHRLGAPRPDARSRAIIVRFTSDRVRDTVYITDSPYYDYNQFHRLIQNNKNNFSILSSNIQSLHAKFNELEAFVTYLQSNKFEFSIICLQESWLSEHDDTSILKLDNYQCISQGKSSSSKGGLIIYVNNNFNYKISQISKRNANWETQIIQISGGGLTNEILICNVYRPPKDLNSDFRKFIEEFSEFLEEIDNKNEI